MKQIVALVCCVAFLADCTWYQGHKTQITSSVKLVAQEAAKIAEQAVYSQALSAADALLKGNNVSGFGDALRQLEGTATTDAIGRIPDTVMKLREIWLGPQTHYTDLAAQLGQLLKTNLAGKTNAQQVALIEAVIKGLQEPVPALVGP